MLVWLEAFFSVPASMPTNVRFSNRPFGVKHFQTIHHCSVDVAHGLVLLFGIGTRGPSIMGFEDEAEQSLGRPYRQRNGGSKRTYELTASDCVTSSHAPGGKVPPASSAPCRAHRFGP